MAEPNPYGYEAPEFTADEIEGLITDRAARKDIAKEDKGNLMGATGPADETSAPGPKGLAYQLRQKAMRQMLDRMREGQAAPQPALDEVMKRGVLNTPAPGRLLSGLPEQGTQWEEAFAACAHPPFTLLRRWQENPQVSQGEWPGAPIPVPFTSREVAGAVKRVYEADRRQGPCGGTLDGTNLFVAQGVAKMLAVWGASGGWVRITEQRGLRTRAVLFHLGDRLQWLLTGFPSPGERPMEPTAVPYDMNYPATTWSHLQRPKAARPVLAPAGGPMSAGRPAPEAWDEQMEDPRRAMLVDLGQPANLASYVVQGLGALSPTPSPWLTQPRPPDGSTESGRSPSALLAMLPLLQGHSIKSKSSCACKDKSPGSTCRCEE